MERLKELVAANAPVLHMHHRDAFMPCSAEFFMANSELWHDEAREQVTILSSLASTASALCLPPDDPIWVQGCEDEPGICEIIVPQEQCVNGWDPQTCNAAG